MQFLLSLACLQRFHMHAAGGVVVQLTHAAVLYREEPFMIASFWKDQVWQMDFTLMGNFHGNVQLGIGGDGTLQRHFVSDGSLGSGSGEFGDFAHLLTGNLRLRPNQGASGQREEKL